MVKNATYNHRKSKDFKRVYAPVLYVIFLFFVPIINIYAQNEVKMSVDSIDVDKQDAKVKKKRNEIESIIVYNSDEQSHHAVEKYTILEGNAYVEYSDIKVFADYIKIDWETGEVFASAKLDKNGNIETVTTFEQGKNKFEYESFSFNFKTKRGIAYNVRMEEDDAVLVSEKVKRINDSISYLRNAIYTTDKYYVAKQDSLPDYHLKISKAKYIQNKSIITGPVQMYIENVPTPLILPFGFFPLGVKRSAGFLFPKFGESSSVGFYLADFGYYQPLGDVADLRLTADYYTKGSWGLHFEGGYKKRYKFSGKLNFDYNNVVSGTQGIDDVVGKELRLKWGHSQDPKLNPYLFLSANVNYSSSQYYRNSLQSDSYLNGNNLINNINSSVSLRKTFPDLPVTMSLNLNHSQNNNEITTTDAEGNKVLTNTYPVSFSLPRFNLTLQRQYPFSPKQGSKKGLLQNLSLGYNLNIENNIKTTDKEVFTSAMFDDMKNGIKHRVNFSTKENLFTYLSFNLNAKYEDIWYFNTFSKKYNEKTKTVDEIKNSAFDTFRTFGLSAGLGTTLYGVKTFKEGSWMKAIRHMVSPSVMFSYRPDFSEDQWGYYDTYIDGENKVHRYSRFSSGVYGGPSATLSKILSLSVSNNLEVKIKKNKKALLLREEKGTSLQKQGEAKVEDLYEKVKIFETFSFGTNYNMAADSFRLGDISYRASTSLMKGLFKIQTSGSILPYQRVYDSRIKKFKKIDEIGDFMLSNYNLTVAVGINNSTFKKKKRPEYSQRGKLRFEDYSFDDQGYAHYRGPWTLGLSMTHNYKKGLNLKSTTGSSINLKATFKPTPYWRMGGSINYDAETKEFLRPSLNFIRDLRSFDFSFTWMPTGVNSTWSFLIRIKNPLLEDTIKYEEKSFIKANR